MVKMASSAYGVSASSYGLHSKSRQYPIGSQPFLELRAVLSGTILGFSKQIPLT